MTFGFFVPQSVAEAQRTKRRVHIPIHAMQRMGCDACPKRDDRNLVSPVMQPHGPRTADLMVLHAAPRTQDDSRGGCGYSEAQAFIGRLLRYYDPGDYITHAIIQCAVQGDDLQDVSPDTAETECCRSHLEAAIEAAKPRLIVGVGDAPLAWIKGMLTGKGAQVKAPDARGSLIACKIGKHECWYMPINFPNFLRNRRAGSPKREQELALEHDLRAAVALVNDKTFGQPTVVDSGYGDGVQVVLGDKAGDVSLVEDFLEWAAGLEESGCDFETNGIRPYLIRDERGVNNPMLLTAAVGTFDKVLAFPVMHPAGWLNRDQRKRIMRALGNYLRWANRILGHNIAFEMEWTNYWFGVDPLRLHGWEDTMLMAHAMDERVKTKSLGAVTRALFGFNVKQLSNVDTARIINYPLPDVLLYNGMDTKWTCAAAEALRNELQRPGWEWAAHEYQRKLRMAPVLVLTSAKGVLVNKQTAQAQQTELEAKQKAILGQITKCPEVIQYTRRFGAFSITNTDHVLTLMKTICQRKEIRNEDWQGNISYSTADENLSAIPEDEVPSAALVLKHRGNEKLLTTYVYKLTGTGVNSKGDPVSCVVADDGCVHSQLSSTIAVTGRLASDDPNIQNIPTRTEEGKRVREAFIPPPDHLFVAADYGQIEARVIGMMSECPTLIRYQWLDYDIHGFWASRILELYPKVKDWVVKSVGVDWDEKGLKALRQETKNKWVFPKFFGAQSNSCADDMHLPYEITDQLEREFWSEFSGVLAWQERLIRQYEKNLYVEIMGGPRRTGPMSRNEIINTPVQGSAAVIVQAAMTELSEYAYMHGRDEFQPNLNVHDDLSTMLPVATLEADLDVYAKIMCRPRFDWIIVPLIVETKKGTDWRNLKHHKDYRSDVLYGLPNPYK